MSGTRQVRAPSAWLPKILMQQHNKDLATPTECTSTSVERMRKRFQRSSGSGTVDFPWNKISGLLLQDEEPAEKSDLFLWRIAHADTWPDCPPSLVQRSGPCAVCAAPSKAWCICGAELAATTRLDLLQEMVHFTRSSCNPMYRPWDPQDQSDMLDEMKKLGGSEGTASVKCVDRHLVRLAYLAGLTSCLNCVRECGPAAMRGASSLEAALTKRKGRGQVLFRGGQYPGKLTSPSEIAEGLSCFEKSIGNQLVSCLKGCSRRASRSDRRQSFHDAIELVASTADKNNSHKVFGLADYKSKKISEALLLMCVGDVGGLHYDISDMDAVVDVWPLPANSRKALKKIFPGVTTDYQARQAMRILQRALRTPEVDCCTLTAQLCFLQEHKIGVLHWVDV